MPENENRQSGEGQSRPILCRKLGPDVSRAIDAFVQGGIYDSRDEALAELAAEGLRRQVEASPTLKEFLSVAERFRQLAEIASSSTPRAQQKQE